MQAERAATTQSNRSVSSGGSESSSRSPYGKSRRFAGAKASSLKLHVQYWLELLPLQNSFAKLLCTAARRTDQVLVNRAEIVVDWRDALNIQLAFSNSMIQHQVETICVARFYKQTAAIVV